MVRLGGQDPDDLHLLTLELVKDHADPVAWTGDLVDDGRMTASKPTVLRKLRDLEDWGAIHRREMGQTFVWWPEENGVGYLQDRIDELEKQSSRLEGRVEQLQEERDSLKTELEAKREELAEARNRAESAEDDLAQTKSGRPTPASSSGLLVPERHPDLAESEDRRWRERVTAWRRLFVQYIAVAGVTLSFGVVFAILQSQIEGMLVALPFLPPETFRIFLAVVAFVWFGAALAAGVSLLGIGVALVSLRSPTVASGAGWTLAKYNSIFSNSDTDGEE